MLDTARTLLIKEGPKFHDHAQFYSATSVFCRSLIVVSVIVGLTVLWRFFRVDTLRFVGTAIALTLLLIALIYTKEMNYRLSVHETLRAALLLTADKR